MVRFDQVIVAWPWHIQDFFPLLLSLFPSLLFKEILQLL